MSAMASSMQAAPTTLPDPIAHFSPFSNWPTARWAQRPSKMVGTASRSALHTACSVLPACNSLLVDPNHCLVIVSRPQAACSVQAAWMVRSLASSLLWPRQGGDSRHQPPPPIPMWPRPHQAARPPPPPALLAGVQVLGGKLQRGGERGGGDIVIRGGDIVRCGAAPVPP